MKIRDMQVIAKGFNAIVNGDYSFFTDKVSGETLPREEAKRRMEEWFINSWNDDDYDYICRDNIIFNYDRMGGIMKICGKTKNNVEFIIRIDRPDMLKLNGIKINF